MKLIYCFAKGEKEIQNPSRKAVEDVASLLIPKEGYFLILDDERHRWQNLFVQTTMEDSKNDGFVSRYIIESFFETDGKRTMYRKTVNYEQLIIELNHYYSDGVLWGSDWNDVTKEIFG